MKPFHSGLASLSTTVTLFYSLYTLVEVTSLNQFMEFVNALLHALDLSMLATGTPYHWVYFAYALGAMVAWAFAINALHTYIHNLLCGMRHHQETRHE